MPRGIKGSGPPKKKATRPPGRPKKTEAERYKTIGVRVTPQLMDRLNEATRDHEDGTLKGGMSWSEYVRACLMAGVLLLDHQDELLAPLRTGTLKEQAAYLYDISVGRGPQLRFEMEEERPTPPPGRPSRHHGRRG